MLLTKQLLKWVNCTNKKIPQVEGQRVQQHNAWANLLKVSSYLNLKTNCIRLNSLWESDLSYQPHKRQKATHNLASLRICAGINFALAVSISQQSMHSTAFSRTAYCWPAAKKQIKFPWKVSAEIKNWKCNLRLARVALMVCATKSLHQLHLAAVLLASAIRILVTLTCLLAQFPKPSPRGSPVCFCGKFCLRLHLHGYPLQVWLDWILLPHPAHFPFPFAPSWSSSAAFVAYSYAPLLLACSWCGRADFYVADQAAGLVRLDIFCLVFMVSASGTKKGIQAGQLGWDKPTD